MWRFKDGYVEYEGSSDLGQYYMKGQFFFTAFAFLIRSNHLAIYVNLATQVKLYMDVAATGVGKLDARNRLLKFYDALAIHEDFVDVDKTEFKEIRKRYRNSHEGRAEGSHLILKECYTSIGTPPPKKAKMDKAKASKAKAALTQEISDDDVPDDDDEVVTLAE